MKHHTYLYIWAFKGRPIRSKIIRMFDDGTKKEIPVKLKKDVGDYDTETKYRVVCDYVVDRVLFTLNLNELENRGEKTVVYSQGMAQGIGEGLRQALRKHRFHANGPWLKFKKSAREVRRLYREMRDDS